MPKLDGMSAAKAIAKRGDALKVVFVTAYDEYALQAFDANAVDYLLKPISESRLEQCVRKLQAEIEPVAEGNEQNIEALFSQLQQMTQQKQPEYLSWIKATKGGRNPSDFSRRHSLF